MAQKLSNLPIGAKIKFGKHQVASEVAQPIIWVVADKNHIGYPSNSITLVTEKIIDMRAYDATEDGYQYGQGNYILSNINQWLNSSASAGQWYSPTHAKDVAPTYKDRPGFLNNFSAYERNLILPTMLNIPIDNNTSSKISPSVFLLSENEIRGVSSVSDDSTRLSYFTTRAINATVTESTYNYSTTKPSNLTSLSATTQYWTRTFTDKYAYVVTATSDSNDYPPSTSTCGVRPALNLSGNTKISDATSTDGYYTIVTNNFPTISGENTNLGTIKTSLSDAVLGFKHTYTITDADGEVVTVTESIDGASVRSYVATLGATNTFDVTGTTWVKLTNGAHTLTITATDGYDTTTRTITFTKSVDKIVVTRSAPIAANTRPTRMVVSVIKHIPEGALMTVEVCNNAFDGKDIVWDTLDASIISSGLAHTFSNGKDGSTPVCTAGKWGVNIRVTVDRNGGEGACYISEIGGNFE